MSRARHILGVSLAGAVGYYGGRKYGGPSSPSASVGRDDPKARTRYLEGFKSETLAKGVIGAAGLLSAALLSKPQSGWHVQALGVLGGYLLGESLLSFSGYELAQGKLNTPVLTVDWERQRDHHEKRCKEKADRRSCELAEIAKARLEPKGDVEMSATVRDKLPKVPDRAAQNAKTSCRGGNNDACCWLKKHRNITIRGRRCVEKAVAGLGYFPMDFIGVRGLTR